MDGEEKPKVGSKRRAKQVDTCLDASDDEPICSFLKSKTKSKKNNVNSRGSGDKSVGNLVEPDDDLVGMDDTLASLRKKLKGPKKGGGRVSKAGVDDGGNVTEPSVQPVIESEENRVSTSSASKKVQVEGSHECAVGLGKGLGGMNRSKIKKSKKTPLLRDIGTNHDPVDSVDDQMRNKNLSIKEHVVDLDPDKGSQKILDEGFEDSLSAFFQKAQSVSVRKSRCSTRLKPENEILISSGGMIGSSHVVTADSQLDDPTMKYSSDLETTSIPENSENICVASVETAIPVLNLERPLSFSAEEHDNQSL